jgi:hypothetical protein
MTTTAKIFQTNEQSNIYVVTGSNEMVVAINSFTGKSLSMTQEEVRDLLACLKAVIEEPSPNPPPEDQL